MINTRPLGRSDVRVSEIGIGGHREGVETWEGMRRTARFFASDEQRAAVVGAAIDAGVTYFDTTFYCEIESLGRSLQRLNRRSGLFVSGMRVDFFNNYLQEKIDIRAYVRREVEACLRAFGFDYLDQFLCGAMEAGDPLAHPKSIMEDALAEFLKLKQEGKVGRIGFSTHIPDYGARLLEAFAAFETVMVPYNFANRACEGTLASVVRQRGTALVAMKPLVWHVYGIPVGVLANLRNVPARLDVDREAPIARLALQFVLANPLVSTCVPAVNSVHAAGENATASGRALSDTERTVLDQYARAMIAENFVPLAIGGLFSRNARVLANALGLLNDRLKLALCPIDWEQDDAENLAIRQAQQVRQQLKDDPRWRDLLPCE